MLHLATRMTDRPAARPLCSASSTYLHIHGNTILSDRQKVSCAHRILRIGVRESLPVVYYLCDLCVDILGPLGRSTAASTYRSLMSGHTSAVLRILGGCHRLVSSIRSCMSILTGGTWSFDSFSRLAGLVGSLGCSDLSSPGGDGRLRERGKDDTRLVLCRCELRAAAWV